ncbi:dipeptide ABC transporter ATP-binding protein [Labrys wisconsinensis]|uniref:ABC-type glutathione transport system ATPase component n=1 Tax=Labrys wisconsinensis TaxID=425677 RepID=A0ABU0JB43_9HYPH|nr:ABC transporter ATP-binding protein [Labrys wisconsinensis]MDQ0470820.1 ABC-type glutathione transport system ATPase component [Labrys wisconsinensis]
MTLAVAIDAIRLWRRHRPPAPLVEDVAFTIPQGATLGLVGESGSGKSLTALAIMGLLGGGLRAEGRVTLDGVDLLRLDDRQMQAVRGARIGMIFQEPMTALNPAMRIGDQIAEGLLAHRPVDRAAARAEALRLIDRVRIPDAAHRIDAYPHELSGGQRQRVGIAIALAPGPSLLIADEPTTALDVTVQAEVLELLGELIAELGMSLLMISHDLGVVASICERTLVMHAGRCVEAGATAEVLHRPSQPYTQRLVAALPRSLAAGPAAERRAAPGAPPLLDVVGLERAYAGRGGAKAVDGVSFAVRAGTIHGIVGESGCGKSTLARIVMGLDRPTAGTVLFEGEDIFAKARGDLLKLRRGFQMVFQDPQGSLDPRQSVGRIVAEPLFLDPAAPRGRAREDLVGETLASVGLRPADAARHPHEFSGGQRQRIAIARAIIGRPKLVVADEPVSALDLTVQAQILRLIRTLRDEHGIAFLLISHSLAVVETISDSVAVMHRGRFVETGAAAEVFRRPAHAYTRRLIEAEPRIDQPRRYGRAVPAGEAIERL